ncbi:chemotaxis protein CheW [Brevibacillus fluminis]|uniref:Chemotaxis protein CheW n=1 Tax=Brevibacillus fluminis TaxID=511487 RepID=A0A3M8DI51_9BACL|nr:chemotaxis protein CheW [Brevibacillus fluminis]RNB87783.1 chemotaxis protein CheW [Brevibacillus fluminis]
MSTQVKKGAADWEMAGDSLQTILFRMGDEFYGLPIEAIKEIIKPLPVTRFPRSPQYVEGIIDLRNKILPIINLRKLFGLESIPLTEESRFIDIHMEGMQVGIVVDAVSEVVRIPVSQVEAAPALIAGVDGKYLYGVARLQDRLILLLDLNATLASIQPGTAQ